jgi:hypothetical protein
MAELSEIIISLWMSGWFVPTISLLVLSII